MPSAFSVANSPLTANGTLSVTGAGTTAQYVRGDGTLATFPTLTGFVPYTGATADVDLGTFNLTADVITGATGSFASNGGSNTFAINHSSGSGIALNITKGGNGEGLYINKTSGSGNAATIIGTLNATTLVKSGGTSSQYLMADGSVSTLTNPVTGTGTTNTLPKFTGASTIGNSNVSDSGTLITLGSNSFVNGSLGVGSSSLTGYNLRVNKSFTGATTTYGVQNEGIVQSDVTGNLFMYNTAVATTAATFTLNNLNHYRASQSTIGAGSSIGIQVGFLVDSSLIGATANQGFRGNIPSGTNRWNLYMAGTAANYLAGDTAIGTTSLGTATMFTLGGTETAVSAIARGGLINTTLVAAANNDVLVGLDINPTFTNGAFTGLENWALRVNGNIKSTFAYSNAFVGNTNLQLSSTGSNNISFQTNSTGIERMRLFGSTGNLQIQNGGTYTDIASARLSVNSTTQGFLPPRMTTTEKNAISSPATGLVVFDTTLGKLCVFATTWQTITST
jgi:hypothetical protein